MLIWSWCFIWSAIKSRVADVELPVASPWSCRYFIDRHKWERSLSCLQLGTSLSTSWTWERDLNFWWNQGTCCEKRQGQHLFLENRQNKNRSCSCRCWPEPRPAGERCRGDPLLCARLELPDDLRVGLEGRVSGCSVHPDRRLQHRGRRRHGKYEQGKANYGTHIALAHWEQIALSYVETLCF